MAALCFSQLISHPVLTNSSLAVVDALKTLQEKIRRLELERKQAQKSYQQYSHHADKHQQVKTSYTVPSQSADSEIENPVRKGK